MPEVVIVGGGLAGLACATRLAQAGIDFRLLEASDRVGGRVRTDSAEGLHRAGRFQLDQGFQFLDPDDPLLGPWLDYDQLRLRKFDPQLSVRTGQGFQKLPAGTPLPSPCRFWTRMLRPFTSGEPAVPADGIAAIPRQLAERLPRGSLALEHTVVQLQLNGMNGDDVNGDDVNGGGVKLSDGRSLAARVVVLATESPAAQRLTQRLASSGSPFDTPWDAALTIYFAADAAALGAWPAAERGLLLAGAEDPGSFHPAAPIHPAPPIHHVTLLSRVAPEYAPPGRVLVSVSLAIDEGDRRSLPIGTPLVEGVRDQLRSWFGGVVDAWQHLRTYSIPYAAPAEYFGSKETPPSVEPFGEAGPVVCGDHREAGTMAGALSSGERAAEAVQRRLGGP
ncbi:FAD-dependent oxidoreductase [Candidatus Laterigemmans baculatus]|uniref:FAD-dependent oxidoreductase n=1 Tax=Candidatus Laterigemmans baculatus TaxID=2770505 RepID=UPI0013DC5D60|nr:FAD-dependent oxidoreductase [Candidatus Laterigemmans baculatus]